mmetsp:Transcript_68672/g.161530  ORF Transcript_68672/g.161530 Transcript_68672/m.161530 type:complete len:423 (-) Transcript_68672:281-1549(-)
MHFDVDVLLRQLLDQAGRGTREIAHELLLTATHGHSGNSSLAQIVEVHALHGTLVDELEETGVGHPAGDAGHASRLLHLHLRCAHGLQLRYVIGLRSKRRGSGSQGSQDLHRCVLHHLLGQRGAVGHLRGHPLNSSEHFLAGGLLALGLWSGQAEPSNSAAGSLAVARGGTGGAAKAAAGAVSASEHHRLVRMHALSLGRHRGPSTTLHDLAGVSGHGHLVAHDQLALGCRLVDELHQLLARDLLLLHKLLGKLIKEVHVVPQKLHAAVVLLIHNALDFRVHLLLQRLRNGWGSLTHEVAAHERTTLLLASQQSLTNLRGHAQGHHHLLGDLRALLEVVGCAGGHVVLAVDDLLCQSTSERHAHAVLEELLGVEARVEPLFRRHEDGHATSRAAGHDADLCDHVIVVHEGTEDGVACLVVGD